MADAIEISITRSSDQRSILIEDITDWASLGTTIDDLTTITLNFYTTSVTASVATYSFTVSEVSEYTSNGEITLTFESIFGTEYIQDNWYIVQMLGNTDEYASNYEGYGTYIYLKNKIYELVNSLHTPELYRGKIERIYQVHMFLKGLEFLDTSNVLSRDIKFKKRLSALTKLIS